LAIDEYDLVIASMDQVDDFHRHVIRQLGLPAMLNWKNRTPGIKAVQGILDEGVRVLGPWPPLLGTGPCM
jgi:hypothetical protein